MEYFFAYAITSIFEIYMIYDFFHDDHEKRFETYWPVAPLALVIVILNTFLPVYNQQYNAAFNIILWWVIIRLTYTGTNKELALRYVVFYFTMSVSEFIVVAVAMLFSKTTYIYFEFVNWFITCFTCKTLGFFLIKLIKKYLFKRTISYNGKAKPLVIIQIIMMVIMFLSHLGLIKHLNSDGYVYATTSLLISIAMFFAMFISADFLSRREREHTEYQMLLAKNDMQMKYYTRIEEIDKQQTIYRHDMKQYLSAIAGLAEEGKSQDILKLIEQMGTDIKAITPKIYTSNGLLNALLGEKESQAQKQDVKIEFTIEPSVNVDFIKETDMVSMFGNLIDNAIRAEKEWDGERKMSVKLFETEGNFLMFCVENHFVGDRSKENGRYITTKVHKDRHGLGIESVKSLANKYGGMLTLNEQGNIFMADLLLSRSFVA